MASALFTGDYLGGSRLGHACERALQFEFARAPKDEGADFTGRLLRIFGIGHALEDLAVAWLRAAGFDLYTRKGGRLLGPPSTEVNWLVLALDTTRHQAPSAMRDAAEVILAELCAPARRRRDSRRWRCPASGSGRVARWRWWRSRRL